MIETAFNTGVAGTYVGVPYNIPKIQVQVADVQKTARNILERPTEYEAAQMKGLTEERLQEYVSRRAREILEKDGFRLCDDGNYRRFVRR